MTADATDVARRSIIAEQNLVIAAAYTALTEARNALCDGATRATVVSAIEAIEHYRQKRDPEHRR